MPAAFIFPIVERLAQFIVHAPVKTALRDMSASFSRDYVAGGMGARHNTHQHRARVLRQLTAQLAAMRAEALLSAS